MRRSRGRDRRSGLHGRVERIRAETAIRARCQDLPGLAQTGPFGERPVEQSRGHAKDDEADPLHRLGGAHGDIGSLGHGPADEGRGSADRIGCEILERRRPGSWLFRRSTRRASPVSLRLGSSSDLAKSLPLVVV